MVNSLFLDITGFEFEQLWAFSLLLLPVFVHLFMPSHKASKDSLQVPYFSKLVTLSGEKPLTGATVLKRKRLQGLVLLISWFLLVVAAAKPVLIGAPIKVEKSARDLMVAVDLSSSMKAEDFVTAQNQQVNRLDAVKLVMRDFAENRQGDRLGLIVFADAAYLQSPFSADTDTWLTLLNETEIGMAGLSTMIGDAIGLSLDVFKQSRSQHKVLILLTDGNDTGSKVPPTEAALIAKAYGVTLYTIAIGDPNTLGEESLDIDTLSKMADITGGGFFLALNRQELANAYQQIDQLEPELYQSESYRPKHDVYHYPLGCVTVLCLLALSYWAWQSSNPFASTKGAEL